MNVLLSIKPKYVEEIKKETKKYEFRKSVFKSLEDSDRVFIYSSFPVKKIVGCFKVGKILEEHPRVLWQELKDFAGIDEEDFFKYFENKEKGFAISIEELDIFKNPVDPKEIKEDFRPPQTFSYIEENLVNKVITD
jgi:predicted transcriptional regulator